MNKMDKSIDEIDNRVITLYTTTATKDDISTLFKEVVWNESTGVITFTRVNGSVLTIDTKLEKLVINFSYDATTEQLVITLDDGTKQYVDMSALVTQYEFLDSDTIAFQLENGKVRAIIKEGSIQGKHLQPDYLADITVQASTATQASQTAQAAAEAAIEAKDSIVAEDLQTKSYMEEAAQSAASAAKSETNAKDSADKSAALYEKIEADKEEIDKTINDSLLASSQEILDKVEGYVTQAEAFQQRAEELYQSLYINIDGGNAFMFEADILMVDCGNAATSTDNGMLYDGGNAGTQAIGL
jgi:hypothetical protein